MICFWMGACELRRDSLHLGSSLRDARSAGEAPDGEQWMIKTICNIILGQIFERKPDIRILRKMNAQGKDANDGVRLLIQIQWPPKNIRVGSETCFPNFAA